MGAENQKMKRKFFCFGCRRSEAKAGGNANRKLLVGITTRAAREKLIIKILRILLEKGSDFIQEPQYFFISIDMYYIYLIQCEDKSVYTGITTDLERRFQEHKNKLGDRKSVV